MSDVNSVLSQFINHSLGRKWKVSFVLSIAWIPVWIAIGLNHGGIDAWEVFWTIVPITTWVITRWLQLEESE